MAENNTPRLIVQVTEDFRREVRSKAAKEGATVQEIGMHLFDSWLRGGVPRPPKEIPDDFVELARVLTSPRDFFEELLRGDLLIKIDALKKWRENESRRASVRP